MQEQSYLVETVLEQNKMFLAFKDSPGNPLSRLPSGREAACLESALEKSSFVLLPHLSAYWARWGRRSTSRLVRWISYEPAGVGWLVGLLVSGRVYIKAVL